MTKYKVTIEDRIYEVQVEEVKEAEVKEAEEGAGTSQPVRTASEPEPVAKTSGPAKTEGGTEVKAPLSGDILSVKVKVGQQVSDGDVLLTLEALKLENEITAPKSGTVTQIVSEGETVTTDQVIAIIS